MKYKILGMKQAKSNKGLIYEKKYKEHKDKTQKIIRNAHENHWEDSLLRKYLHKTGLKIFKIDA